MWAFIAKFIGSFFVFVIASALASWVVSTFHDIDFIAWAASSDLKRWVAVNGFGIMAVFKVWV